MSKFAPGEIAIYWCPGNEDHRMEVTVVGPLELHEGDWYYPIDCPKYRWCYPFKWTAIKPDNLRKRRPPQDWVRLCGLTDTPADKPLEVA